MYPAGTKVGLVIQAYRNLGKESIDDAVRGRTKKFLKGTTERELTKNLKYAPQWIRSIIFAVMKVAP
jgi:hypothetical protein